MCFLFVRIATDIFDQKLEKAKIMGADVVVNGRIDNLKDIGEFEIFLINLVACCWVDFLVIYKASLCVLQSLGNIVSYLCKSSTPGTPEKGGGMGDYTPCCLSKGGAKGAKVPFHKSTLDIGLW